MILLLILLMKFENNIDVINLYKLIHKTNKTNIKLHNDIIMHMVSVRIIIRVQYIFTYNYKL
jgi:hypothetical protein